TLGSPAKVHVPVTKAGLRSSLGFKDTSRGKVKGEPPLHTIPTRTVLRERTTESNPTRKLSILLPYRVWEKACVPIGHYWYLFKRLTAVSSRRFYRFVHIVTYSSGKVVAKSAKRSLKKICVRILEYQPLRQSPGLKVPTEPRPKSSSSVTALCGIGRGPVGAGKINPLSWAGQADSEPTGLVFQESTRSRLAKDPYFSQRQDLTIFRNINTPEVRAVLDLLELHASMRHVDALDDILNWHKHGSSAVADQFFAFGLPLSPSDRNRMTRRSR